MATHLSILKTVFHVKSTEGKCLETPHRLTFAWYYNRQIPFVYFRFFFFCYLWVCWRREILSYLSLFAQCNLYNFAVEISGLPHQLLYRRLMGLSSCFSAFLIASPLRLAIPSCLWIVLSSVLVWIANMSGFFFVQLYSFPVFIVYIHRVMQDGTSDYRWKIRNYLLYWSTLNLKSNFKDFSAQTLQPYHDNQAFHLF